MGPPKDSGPGLPTRFHIGTQRAGSSFVYNLLRSHPQVSLSPLQEIHFYTKHFERGLDWYRDCFPESGIAVDTSPKYFQLGREAAPRIADCIPADRARFLLILRDPVEYLYSHFRMQLRQRYFRSRPDLYRDEPKDLGELISYDPGYLERAMYARTLTEHWFVHFAPAQFKIVIFEEFVREPERAMGEILDFLEIPFAELSAGSGTQNRALRHRYLYNLRDRLQSHPGIKKRLRSSRMFDSLYSRFLVQEEQPIEPALRDRLTEHLEEDVVRLRELTGRSSLPWAGFSS